MPSTTHHIILGEHWWVVFRERRSVPTRMQSVFAGREVGCVIGIADLTMAFAYSFRPPGPDAPKTRSTANRRQSQRADGSHLARMMAPCQQMMKSEASRSGSSSAAICPAAWASEIRAATLVFQSRTPSAICVARAEGSAGLSAEKVLMSWSGDTSDSRVEGAMD